MWGITAKKGSDTKQWRTETQEQAEQMAKQLHDKGYKVFVYSRLEAFPPDENKKPRSKKDLWCPYCNEYRKFTDHHCSVCGISTSDFYVRKYNHLWGMMKRG